MLTNTRSTSSHPSYLAITKLLDVEEDIWSPTYGLKGKLDATVHAVISDPAPSTPFSRGNPERALASGPVPLELKTGRAVAGLEHRAQTMLYTLLLSERYGVDVPSGLLYYTQSEEVVRVPRMRNEIRGLIGARNEMAGFMMRRMRLRKAKGSSTKADERDVEDEPFLPPTIDDERVCKRCYVVSSCMLYRKVCSFSIFSPCSTHHIVHPHSRLLKMSLTRHLPSPQYTNSTRPISLLVRVPSSSNGKP